MIEGKDDGAAGMIDTSNRLNDLLDIARGNLFRAQYEKLAVKKAARGIIGEANPIKADEVTAALTSIFAENPLGKTPQAERTADEIAAHVESLRVKHNLEPVDMTILLIARFQPESVLKATDIPGLDLEHLGERGRAPMEQPNTSPMLK